MRHTRRERAEGGHPYRIRAVSPELAVTGLTAAEAASRLAQHGSNSLPEKAAEPFLKRFLRQFASPLIYILLFALAVDFGVWVREGGHGVPFESLVIAAILLMNAGLGVWQEAKAESALARLKSLATPQAWVLRDGQWTQQPATDLVPGDVVRLEAGDRVPADGALRGPGVAVDESILTGESLPVEKTGEDEMFSGTLVSRGKSIFEVTRTGAQSALGRLAGLLESLEEEATPLERRLTVFGHRIAKWVLALTAFLIVEGVVTEGTSRIAEIVLFAVALAVAAVPEGLPAVLTLTLALGVERMAARKAVVRRLAAVEALGSVTVIATDKTGTLTENAMQVREVDSPDEQAALRAMTLANEADGGAGDPMDLALLAYAESKGFRIDQPQVVSSRPFDSNERFMRTSIRLGGEVRSYLKGAPEVILGRSRLDGAEREAWAKKALDRAADGFRVLGLAEGEGEAESDLAFCGLVMFWDPPRAEVPGAVRQAREAGIRVLMITGDHPATAQAIAANVGIEAGRVMTGEELDRLDAAAMASALAEVNVFARVRPEHKLKLVEALQARGEIVAMTGDGVNDAPALKRSDVGVAMGQRGSDVSREVADLVLLDDNFATIVSAIEEGRSIYENVQKFIRFLFSTNLSEVLIVSAGMMLAAVIGLRDAAGHVILPLTAVQILWINLVTDGLPALSLALDRNPEAMRRAPREPSAPLLDRSSLRFILVSGTIKGMLALGLLGLGRLGEVSMGQAQSMAFHFMAIGQLLFAYPARHTELKPLPNPVLHWAVVAGVLIQIAVGSIPGSLRMFGLAELGIAHWGVVIGAACTAWAIAELLNRLFWHHSAKDATSPSA